MTRPNAPVFQTLDGRPALMRMLVDDASPAVRVTAGDAADPIDMYDWQLVQDGEVKERGTDVTAGITDGTCIQFKPTFVLRRGPLPPGWFFPPFKPGLAYKSETYAHHSDFAVDFNRGASGVDEGDPVFAAAGGTVSFINFRLPGTDGPADKGDSDLIIDHVGAFQTLYTHMKDIPKRLFEPNAKVRLGDRVGRISAIGNAKGSHLHHQHRLHGQPFKMRILGVDMDASVADSDTRPDGWGVTGQTVLGVRVRPFVRVRVRRQSDAEWSAWRRLEFRVSRTGEEVPDAVDPGCGAPGVGAGAPD